jgi:CelD/BcsL family acetyltransferase involved in cellulose biosynthesis
MIRSDVMAPVVDMKMSAERPSSLTAHWLLPDETAEWDRFVARHPLGLVYHLSAWTRVLETAFPHIQGRFLVLRDGGDGSIRAGLPVYTVKSWLLGRRVISVPFASFCDPLVSSAAEFDLLLPHLEQLQRSTKSRLLEVRLTRTAGQLADRRFTLSSGYKHHYLRLDTDCDSLFESFAKTSIRQKIRKAANAGVTVEERTDEGCIEACHAILAETRMRRFLPVMPYTFFQAVRRWLWPEYLKVFIASESGKPVACHLVLTFKDLWISEYSGDTAEARAGTNQLLYWDTIRRAHAAGAKIFSFGRTSASNEGLLAYKKRWCTVEEDIVALSLERGRKSSEDQSEDKKNPGLARESSLTYRAARFIVAKAPMRISHLIGNFCYRHLG